MSKDKKEKSGSVKEKSGSQKGKEFERQFKLSAEKQDILIVRLNDTELSFNPNLKRFARFTAKNPCDFIVYKYPNIFFLELKRTKYNSLSIQRTEDEDEKNKMLKLHQMNSLNHLSNYEGSYAGFIINFQPDDEEEETYFLSVQNLLRFLCDSEKKTINKMDIILYGGIKLEQKLLKVKYLYDVNKLLETLTTIQGGENGVS